MSRPLGLVVVVTPASWHEWYATVRLNLAHVMPRYIPLFLFGEKYIKGKKNGTRLKCTQRQGSPEGASYLGLSTKCSHSLLLKPLLAQLHVVGGFF